MKHNTIFPRLQFFVLLLIPFGLALLAFAMFYGCNNQKQPEEKKEASYITYENLQTAYSKSIRHRYMYTLFVKQAEKERQKQIANLYRAIARSEDIHAKNHAQLLKSKGIQMQEPPIDSLTIGTVLQT